RAPVDVRARRVRAARARPGRARGRATDPHRRDRGRPPGGALALARPRGGGGARVRASSRPAGGQRGRRVSNTITLQVFALVLLIVCSAVLTGAEAAYFSLGRARLKRMPGAGGRSGANPPLIERPHDLLVTLLVGITLINIGGSALAAHIAHELVGPRFGPILEMLGMTVLLTTFGEVLPMTVAVKYPERFLAIVN